MRKAIGWTLAWALYWIGHAVSRTAVTPRYVDSLPQIWCDCFYCIYNKLMTSGWIWIRPLQGCGRCAALSQKAATAKGKRSGLDKTSPGTSPGQTQQMVSRPGL